VHIKKMLAIRLWPDSVSAHAILVHGDRFSHYFSSRNT